MIFEVEVQRGQHTAHDVRRRERIAAVFREDDAVTPEALALRSDFPLVPHVNALNLTFLEEFPRSLCLYDQPYHDLKLRWTSIAFVQNPRVVGTHRQGGAACRRPTAGAAAYRFSGRARASFGSLRQRREYPGTADRRVVEHEGNVRAVVAGYEGDSSQERHSLRYVATSLVGESQEHGVIESTPTTLRELRDSLKSAGLDLFEELHARLDSWRGSDDLVQLLDMELLLIVALPKKRGASGPVEASDVWAFVCKEGAGKLGERLGVWQAHDGHLGVLLGNDGVDLQGEDVTLLPLNVNYALSRHKAGGAKRRRPSRWQAGSWPWGRWGPFRARRPS